MFSSQALEPRREKDGPLSSLCEQQSVRSTTHIEIDKSVKVVIVVVSELVEIQISSRRHGLIKELAYAILMQLHPADKILADGRIEPANLETRDGFRFNSTLND